VKVELAVSLFYFILTN